MISVTALYKVDSKESALIRDLQKRQGGLKAFVLGRNGARASIRQIKEKRRRYRPIPRGDAMIFKMLIADKPL